MTSSSTSPTATFVHARDGRLADGSGELLLRGVALGGWLLPEGYMWRLGDHASSPRQIEALVTRLVGKARNEEFWPRYRDAFVTHADVAAIAAAGFDHVRVPINARIVQDDAGEPIEAGYRLLDRVIGWAAEAGLRVLLDLHGAPGGQTGTNIDDSPRGLPELFMDARYRALTVRLWTDLATRYAHEPAVLGYDLLNEPLPNDCQHTYADDLVQLYQDLTAAIRRVDPDHLLVYEGTHWATNVDIFDRVWDPNSCVQFHRYWSAPDTAGIERFLRLRDRLGLPLSMGEGGENTLEWLYTAARLYERHEIGWNLWTWKKVDTRTSPVSVPAPDGWDAFLASSDGTPRLGPDEAWRVLEDLLAALPYDEAEHRPDVVRAVLGRAPAVLPAWGFGFRGAGTSFGAARDDAHPVLRAEEPVAIVWAGQGPHPDNPFEQNDGRPYTPQEELAVDLHPGDWLEFELDAVPDARHYTAVTREGVSDAIDLQRSDRGLRATARRHVTLLRLVRTVEPQA
ncbi:MAG: glycoside hydrolase family 5 protein [Cellulomonas sp.]|nr:glycoside hydrolase family 5 protein [Cellulomonas sp.]